MRPLFQLTSAAIVATACQSEVSLGRWEKSAPVVAPGVSPDAGGVITTDDPTSQLTQSQETSTFAPSMDASLVPPDAADAATPSVPMCLEGLGVGQLSPLSAEVRVTETATDWNLTEPVSELEWTVMIEQDVLTPQAKVGYYWHNQFSFVPGVAGRFGLQSRGLYQNALGEAGEFTKIIVFWLSGPPLAAELGDIEPPNARYLQMNAAGLVWGTIHARFDWQVCRTYRFRVGIESIEAVTENMWYGAWITDETTAEVTFLGRMKLAKETGLLSSFSSSRTLPIDHAPVRCSDLEHVSAIFTAPTSGAQTSTLVANHFMPPTGCARSIIGGFENAVRHELGVVP